MLRRDKEDLDARYDRAMLYADMGESRKAIEGLEQVGSGWLGWRPGGWVGGMPADTALSRAVAPRPHSGVRGVTWPFGSSSRKQLHPSNSIPTHHIPPQRPTHPNPNQVQAVRPDHSEVPKALARLFHRIGQAARAVQVLRAYLSNFPRQVGASVCVWRIGER